MNAEAIRLLALGDYFLGGEFLTHAHKKKLSPLSPFKDITPLITESDILLINLEGPLYNNGKKRLGSTSHLSNHLSAVDLLTKSPNVIVNLANNHILDYGNENFSQTIKLLHEKNIQTIGAGVDIKTAYKPALLNINSKSIAFVAFTTNEPHVGSIIVDEGHPGCASLSDIEKISHKIQNLKQKVDYVVVVLHWGFEYFQYPSPHQVEIAHKMVDAGANLIIGHHPHVIQGVENFNNAIILYSIGNFFFPPYRDLNERITYQKEISKEGLVAEIKIDAKNEKCKLRSLGSKRRQDYFLELYDGPKQNNFQKYLHGLSSPLALQDYASFWEQYKSQRIRELKIESLKEVLIRVFAYHPKETIGKMKREDIIRNIKRLKMLLSK